jgi:hypothetical protein
MGNNSKHKQENPLSTWDRGKSRKLSKAFSTRVFEDQYPYLNSLGARQDESVPGIIRLIIDDHQVIGRILEPQSRDLREYAEAMGITITAGGLWNAVSIAQLASIHLGDWTKRNK